MGFLHFAISSWKGLLIFFLLITIGALFLQNQILRLEHEKLKTEHKHLTERHDACQRDNKKLSESIDTQNQAIDKFKKDADERLKKKEEELRQANIRAKIFKDRASELISRVPPPNKNECEASLDLINEELNYAK